MITRATLLTFLLLLPTASALAGVGTAPPPREGFQNVISAGLSAGVIDGRDADFWGWSLNYGRLVAEHWSWEGSLLWDSETEDRTDGSQKRVRSYTLSTTASYLFNERWSLSGGMGLGVASDDNPRGSMDWENGDFSVGLVGGYTLPRFQFSNRDALTASLAVEYNVSQKEPSISLDLVWGWSF